MVLSNDIAKLMVYELEPFKDFILASEVKVDLVGQTSFFCKTGAILLVTLLKRFDEDT